MERGALPLRGDRIDLVLSEHDAVDVARSCCRNQAFGDVARDVGERTSQGVAPAAAALRPEVDLVAGLEPKDVDLSDLFPVTASTPQQGESGRAGGAPGDTPRPKEVALHA